MRKFNQIKCAEFTRNYLNRPQSTKDGMLYLVAQNSLEDGRTDYFVQMLKEQYKNAPKKVTSLLGDKLINDLLSIEASDINIIKKHWDNFDESLYDNVIASRLKVS